MRKVGSVDSNVDLLGLEPMTLQEMEEKRRVEIEKRVREELEEKHRQEILKYVPCGYLFVVCSSLT